MNQAGLSAGKHSISGQFLAFFFVVLGIGLHMCLKIAQPLSYNPSSNSSS
jgi:hypothetical protein